MTVYRVTDQQLEGLWRGGNIRLAGNGLLGFFVAILISFLVAILGAPPDTSRLVRDFYIVMCVAGGVGTVVVGVLLLATGGHTQHLLEMIRRQATR